MLDKTKQSIDDLIHQLNIISNQEFDMNRKEAQENKNQLLLHPLNPALFAELCVIKNRTALSTRAQLDLPDIQLELTRLDNMLLAEGVIGPERRLAENSNNPDYTIKLAQIRQSYQDEIAQNERDEAGFSKQVVFLLQEHKSARPITTQEITRFVESIRQKFINAQLKIKQRACERVIESKSKLFDARRKRRNFNKHTTEILTNYFNTHIDNPYPDDAAKELLAKQCNISVVQVANWFGNKRIRYKKSIPRMQLEVNNVVVQQAAQQAAEHVAQQAAQRADQYEALSEMLNPYYAAMFPPNPNFY